MRRGSKRVTQYKDSQTARRNGAFAAIDETTPGNLERTDDGLVAELKNVFIISKNLDYAGLRYANSAHATTLNGHTSGEDIMLNNLESDGVWESESTVSFTGVLDENGEELAENELTLRHWEWIMAARVLDRALLWVAIICGIVTFLAIFLKAPRFQKILFGS